MLSWKWFEILWSPFFLCVENYFCSFSVMAAVYRSSISCFHAEQTRQHMCDACDESSNKQHGNVTIGTFSRSRTSLCLEASVTGLFRFFLASPCMHVRGINRIALTQ
jgi:hypothetical protein